MLTREQIETVKELLGKVSFAENQQSVSIGSRTDAAKYSAALSALVEHAEKSPKDRNSNPVAPGQTLYWYPAGNGPMQTWKVPNGPDVRYWYITEDDALAARASHAKTTDRREEGE